jgi:ankyrin repeat protein
MTEYPLHKRILNCDIDGVEALILQGSDLNELDNLGSTPLYWAVLGGYYDIVKLLLKSGANPNTFCSDGTTPKWTAIDFGLTEIEQLLTVYGGKVLTNEKFDKASWSVFKNALGQELPKNDLER